MILLQTNMTIISSENEFFFILNPKTTEGGMDCRFSKNLSSKVKVKTWFFVTFNIIISHIFSENVIKNP